MNEVTSDPWTLVRLLYFFAAIFALGAGVFWFRFVTVQTERQAEGGPISIRWLREAGTGTALALFCAGGAYLISLTI